MKYDASLFEVFSEERTVLTELAEQMGLSLWMTSDTIQHSGLSQLQAPLVSIRTQSIIPVTWKDAISGILTRSTGYDHVTRFLKEVDCPIPAGSLGKYCGQSVAEQALLLWMALMRDLPSQMASCNNFSRNNLTGFEMSGKHLLVVGVGDIGHRVAKAGIGLGMKVTGVDIDQRHDDIHYEDFQKALPSTDVIVCAMNLTDTSRNYFNRNTLSNAKPSLIFVNVSRGECSPSSELLLLLDEGKLSGVGLDVFDDESSIASIIRDKCPETTLNKEVESFRLLLEHPRAILTPHNAFNTHEALRRKALLSIEQLVKFKKCGRFDWPVPPA